MTLDTDTVETLEQRDRRLANERLSKRLGAIREYISDEEQPANVRVSIVGSGTVDGGAEIHLFTQSPYHLTVVTVAADAREGHVESAFRSGMLQHQRALKNMGAK